MRIQGKIWGQTSPLFNRHNVEVHYCKIRKGGYCSIHRHKHKFNQFIVLNGKLKVKIWKDYGTETLEDACILSDTNECIVPPNDYHQFIALEDCEILEIYWTDLSASDIERKSHGGLFDETSTDFGNEVKGTSCIKEKGASPALAYSLLHDYGKKNYGND